MTETIGKITLNLDKYPGEDYYCDGSVEDEILDIVKKYSGSLCVMMSGDEQKKTVKLIKK